MSLDFEAWVTVTRLGDARGVFVTGTDTGVGKTWVGSRLIQQLQARGLRVIPRKPVESGWTDVSQADTGLLAAAAGADPGEVCRYRLQAALSPPRAAQLEGQVLSLQMLRDACYWAIPVDKPALLWVEGAGGFYSPLAHDGLNADLAEMLGFPVLLVAEDRVGCINHVLLVIEAAQRRGLRLAGIILNRCQHAPAEMDNAADLRQFTDIPILHSLALA